MDEGFMLYAPDWLLRYYHGMVEPLEGSIEELQERQYQMFTAMAFMRVMDALRMEFPGWPIGLSPLTPELFENMEDLEDDDDSLTPL